MAYSFAPSIARSRVSRQEREQAERVLAHVGDGVFLVDRDGVIRLWNPAAEAITGLRSDAISNRPAEETIPGWEAIAERVPVARRPGDADDASSPETVPIEIDGREVWLSIVGVTPRRRHRVRIPRRDPRAAAGGAPLPVRRHDLA